jgi:hypothetical protein
VGPTRDDIKDSKPAKPFSKTLGLVVQADIPAAVLAAASGVRQEGSLCRYLQQSTLLEDTQRLVDLDLIQRTRIEASNESLSRFAGEIDDGELDDEVCHTHTNF